MAYKTSYELHHNFVKLAEESGFAFNVHRSRVHIDWNKIKTIDIDKLIRDRNFSAIEKHSHDVLDCVLESEFDVRILDEGVVKLFRLAQLAVEYQQFCRHHLDRSVMLLREELVSVMQEIERSRKELRNKDEEIRRLRKKAKHIYKSPLPYGNDNIATMILKTLSNNGDGLVSPCMGDTLQYNKCRHCDKVFLNQLYLKSHVSRRHQLMNDIDNVTTQANEKTNQLNSYVVENTKLSNEVLELKCKLQDMERKFERKEIKTTQAVQTVDLNEIVASTNIKKLEDNGTKYAEQSVDNQKYLLDKIEEWKHEEQEKYKAEISLLKEQIMANINTIKDNHIENARNKEIDDIKQLRATINEQNSEIAALKQELMKMIKSIEDNNKKELELKRKTDIVEPARAHQTDASQQYEELINSWDQTPQATYVAHADLYDRQLIDATTCKEPSSNAIVSPHKRATRQTNINNNFIKKDNQQSLEELHRKTQELLNIYSSSETSSSDKPVAPEPLRKRKMTKQKVIIDQNDSPEKITNFTKVSKHSHIQTKKHPTTRISDLPKTDEVKFSAPKRNVQNKLSRTKTLKTSSFYDNEEVVLDKIKENIIHTSPAKVIRAKITEEVHKRLVTSGVDPLKMGVQNDVFHKQRSLLRQEEEIKKKKNPSYEKVRHSILTFLDSKTTEETIKSYPIVNKARQDKIGKNFNLTSVFSNVKSKALSFIKPIDKGNRLYRKSINSEVVKRAESLLKTPPSSDPASPVTQKRASVDYNHPYQTRYLMQKAKDTRNTSKKRSNISQKNPVKVEVTNHKIDYDTDSDQSYSEKKDVVQISSKSIEHLINSPVKRPATVNGTYSPDKTSPNKDHASLLRTQSTTNLYEYESNKSKNNKKPEMLRFTITENGKENNDHNISDDESITKSEIKKFLSDDNVLVRNINNAKGVLKNASSTSLSKKKVLFDLDANQMKSVSASPSQSTERGESITRNVNESLNLEEEWDISSIDSVPVKASHVQNLTSSRTTPKIAELKQRIESQLARRSDKPPGVGVDVLRGPAAGGSNTSLGSSLPDDIDEPLAIPRKTKPHIDKDDSDLDLSEFSIDDITKDYRTLK